jgi:hypothetical protein
MNKKLGSWRRRVVTNLTMGRVGRPQRKRGIRIVSLNV